MTSAEVVGLLVAALGVGLSLGVFFIIGRGR